MFRKYAIVVKRIRRDYRSSLLLKPFKSCLSATMSVSTSIIKCPDFGVSFTPRILGLGKFRRGGYYLFRH
jgi:hypothetical protein